MGNAKPGFDRAISLDLDWILWRMECTELSSEEREALLTIKAVMETHIPANAMP